MTPFASQSPVLDDAILKDMPDALKAVFPAMVEAGLRDIEEQMALFNANLHSQDARALSGVMHSLKSCAAQLGGVALSEFAANREGRYRSGQLDTVAADHQQLDTLVGEFKTALLAYARQMPQQG